MRTTQRLIGQDAKGRIREITLPADLQKEETLHCYGGTPIGILVAKEGPLHETPEGKARTRTVYQFSSEGILEATREVVLRYTSEAERDRPRQLGFYSAFGVVGSVFCLIDKTDYPYEEWYVPLGARRERTDLPEGHPSVGRWQSFRKRFALAGSVFSLLLALFALLWEHRYHGNLISQVVWFIYVLLFGLPGLVGYLTHRKWPARLPCAHCGSKMPVTTKVCPKCSAPVLPPEHTPREIFA